MIVVLYKVEMAQKLRQQWILQIIQILHFTNIQHELHIGSGTLHEFGNGLVTNLNEVLSTLCKQMMLPNDAHSYLFEFDFLNCW